MNATWQTVLGGVAVTAACGILPAHAADNGFGDWDTDSSGMIDQTEWDAGYADKTYIGSWNADSDERTNVGTRSEVYEKYDVDSSGDWSEEEYGAFHDERGSAETTER
ncbi:MAG TPA: hypothetical protein ENI17_12425 [Pseudomonas xinjiangensis]|uniref:EF hand n=2 Tax=root TaxID=1 RepID=A0A7V1BM13_9GAMM|nr:hypothetical protein [Halopseudomonas xinjiangensis]HEC48417.1 hypothetical protein [Halopseudomonas xinjiangensis]